jgi:PAS domain S-box-containing protein
MVLETILNAPDYRLVKASSGDQALMALMHEDFAAIVLDVQMPDLNGIELARLIKQRKKTQHIPILFLTAYYQEDEHVMLGYGVGAVDYITKPVNPAVLRSKVGVFIDLFRKTAALAEMNRALEAEIVERKRAEERFRLVVETAPNAMVALSEGGQITLVNSRTELLFGFERGELLGQPITLLVPEHFGFRGNDPTPGEPVDGELIGRRKDGACVPIEVGLSRFQTADGNFELASFVDITERKRAEAALRTANAELEAKNEELQRQAEDRVRRIRAEAAKAEAEAARERSALLAEASNLLTDSFDANQTLAGLARLAVARLAECCLIDIKDEASALHLRELAFRDAGPTPDRLASLCQRLAAESERHEAVEAVIKSGQTEIWTGFDQERLSELGCSGKEIDLVLGAGFRGFVIAPLSARGRVLGTLSLARAADHNFTRSEVALIEELAARAALAFDNARLYHDAAQAREAAEAANSAKDRFLAMLSHELRTPLSPVLHAVALLEEDENCQPDARETLQTIRRNVQLEARLIDDLLDLARIRNGKLQLHPEAVDAHDLARRAVEICEPEIAARGLQLKLDLRAGRSQLDADPARIQQIFWNLINNAIKFTPPGGVIALTTTDESTEQALRVEISDSGIGIDFDRLERIFDAFEQAHGDRSTGLGLGLAICRALTELHGGRIEAKSAGEGHGSTFSVVLPAAAVARANNTVPPAEQPEHPPKRLRVLLVEDHADTVATLERLLVRRGYQVESVGSLAAALAVLDEAEFDVLVSDIGLPDGSGLEIMPKFLEAAGDRAVGGIALSGFGMPEDIERSTLAGFHEHLTKPVEISLLHKALERIGKNVPAQPRPALAS